MTPQSLRRLAAEQGDEASHYQTQRRKTRGCSGVAKADGCRRPPGGLPRAVG